MLMSQMFGAGQWISCAYKQLSRFLHVSHIEQKFYNGMPYRYPQNKVSIGISAWVTSIVTRTMASLNQMHRKGPPKPKPRKRTPMDGRPQLKGVVLKTLIKKPKKPNSANRKCVRLRLSTGKEVTAYVPGEGHNLQEHSIVLVRGGRVPDLPGVKLKCIRGKYDLAHVKK